MDFKPKACEYIQYLAENITAKDWDHFFDPVFWPPPKNTTNGELASYLMELKEEIRTRPLDRDRWANKAYAMDLGLRYRTGESTPLGDAVRRIKKLTIIIENDKLSDNENQKK